MPHLGCAHGGEGKGSARHRPFTSQCGSAPFVRSALPMARPMLFLWGAPCKTAQRSANGEAIACHSRRSRGVAAPAKGTPLAWPLGRAHAVLQCAPRARTKGTPSSHQWLSAAHKRRVAALACERDALRPILSRPLARKRSIAKRHAFHRTQTAPVRKRLRSRRRRNGRDARCPSGFLTSAGRLAPPQGERSARGTASSSRSSARCGGRTRPRSGRRRVRRRCRSGSSGGWPCRR